MQWLNSIDQAPARLWQGSYPFIQPNFIRSLTVGGSIDQQTYNRMGRCRVCQLEFEADLHRKGKWNDWVADMEKKRWESVKAEYDQEMADRKDSKTLQFDTDLANAIAKESHR